MSKILNIGETKTITASSKTYRGAQFSIIMQHTTANTAFLASALNLDNLRVAARLMQNGKKASLCNDRASILFRESGFKTAAFDGTFSVTNWTTLVAAASGVKAKVLVTGFVDFGGPINLHKGDVLDLEATLNTGAFGSTVDSSASFVLFQLVEGQGVQYGYQTIETFSIPANESLFNLEAGDNVQRVTFVNTDTESVLEDDRIIDNVNVSGADWASVQQYNELCAGRLGSFENSVIANTRYQSFVLYDGEDLDSVNTNFNLVPTNVAAGKNNVVIRRFHTCEQTLAKGVAKAAHVTEKLREKIGLGRNPIPKRFN
jgi:hypothetical protein